MAQRLSERQKELHGTRHKRPPDPRTLNAPPRLMRPIAPPRDLPAPIKAQWRMHMQLIVASGRTSSVDLLAFRQLCQCAHGVDVAYAQALQDGPTEAGQNNEPKAGTAWRMWLATMAQYQRWLADFGLTPRSRGLGQLPVAMADLVAITGGRADGG